MKLDHTEKQESSKNSHLWLPPLYEIPSRSQPYRLHFPHDSPQADETSKCRYSAPSTLVWPYEKKAVTFDANVHDVNAWL